MSSSSAGFRFIFSDQGGLIYHFIIGVRRNAVELDFEQMLPAIMVKYRMDPTTIGVEGPDSFRIPETNLYVDQIRMEVVPLSLMPLLDKRTALKKWMKALPKWDPQRDRD